ncbi:type I-F CRISPR-associated protein Csy2 [Photobacterium leiognathi]|uniref:type I-F CRISPR-associated protein Csy2 n=1 Tax=Photobacterium leiognathi TaxID=553611 RepID=UPI002981F766|nr:type I-F CRISPR-associated protein Csy2 [Photobacterium leiognathi]
MNLSSIIKIREKVDREKALRQSLAPYSPPIAVDGEEFKYLVVLVNLTVPRKKIDDLLDAKHAEELWRNDVHLNKCLSEASWYHSHNLKYPDPRVSHQVYRGVTPSLYPDVLTSANLPCSFGWSNNSAMVNIAKLFSSEFLWNGNLTTLGLLLVKRQSLWLDLLISLGVKQDTLDLIISFLSDELGKQKIPIEVSDYSKQLQFVMDGQPVAITPIVSHAVQVKIHQLSLLLRSSIIQRGHPASVSGFVASTGGFTRVLNYRPFVRKRTGNGLLKTFRNKKDCFDNQVLSSQRFINALKCISKEELAPTLRQRRQLRISALRFIRKQLALWLAPIMEWRDCESDSNNHPELKTIGEKLVFTPLAQLPELASELNVKFHQSIQYSKHVSRYAFHPELMLPIKTQLLWLLRYLSIPQDAHKSSCSSVYLHLRSLKVTDASALSNPYISGIPSLTALWGFVNNYQSRINKLTKTVVEVQSVAWFINDYNEVKNKKLPEPSIPESKRKVGNIKRSGIIDGKYCDMTIDLVIKLKIEDDFPEIQLLQAALPSRFAGGTLLPPSLYELRDWLEVFDDKSELFSVISRKSRFGCWVYPSDEKLESFEQLEQKLTLEPDLKPVNMGFIPLDVPCNRENSISNFHCYAEPCIGVVQCKNPIEVRLEASSKFFESAFWHLDNENGAILMRKYQ